MPTYGDNAGCLLINTRKRKSRPVRMSKCEGGLVRTGGDKPTTRVTSAWIGNDVATTSIHQSSCESAMLCPDSKRVYRRTSSTVPRKSVALINESRFDVGWVL